MRKIMGILKRNNRPIMVRVFDALVKASSCGTSGCECEQNFSSPNLTELQMLASRLIEKYGRVNVDIELFDVHDSSIKKFNDVYNIVKEKKDSGLPIISINGKIRFVGRVPSFEEVDSEIQAVM